MFSVVSWSRDLQSLLPGDGQHVADPFPDLVALKTERLGGGKVRQKTSQRAQVASSTRSLDWPCLVLSAHGRRIPGPLPGL